MSAEPSLTGTVRVTLPLRLVNEANGSHGHWAAKAKRRREQRTLTAHVVGMHVRACRVSLPCVVTITRIAPSNGLDDDNLRVAAKAARDGVADALGVDDRHPGVFWRYEQRRSQRRAIGAVELGLVRGYGVEIRIEPHA